MPESPLHLLCIEPHFPGRLGAVADWLVRRRGCRCRYFCHTTAPPRFWPESIGKGLDLVRFNVGGVARESAVSWTRYLERGLCHAYGCWEILDRHRPRPVDLILGRSAGLGSTLFTPITLPHVPIVNFFDYFYHPHRHDLAEESDLPPAWVQWRRSANAMDLLDLENATAAWVPTPWQRDLFPPEYRGDFHVLFDGVDAGRFCRRDRSSPTRTIQGRTVPPDYRIVTFVASALDRLRGFDRFLDLANRLLRARSDVICIAVGAPIVQRGLDVQFFNRDYRAHLLAQTPPVDADRLWFLDTIVPSDLASLLGESDLHVYPSRPFAVSRSLVEAMSAGCVVLAGDTEPVREFVTHENTGLLVPPADPEAWERHARAILDDPAGHRSVGDAAARLVRDRYAQDATLPELAEWFARLVGHGKS
jgi:glycosyltransferase involved in cell wall biosynthesis